MPNAIALIALLVRDCEDAIHFFTKALRFQVREDSGADSEPRWLVVAPSGAEAGPGLMLRRAESAQDVAQIGRAHV